MAGRMLWLAVAVAVVGLAYYFWTPLPDDLDQKGLVYSLAIFKKITTPLRTVVSMFKSYSNMYEYNRDCFALLTRAPPLDSDPELKVTNEVFNGVPVRVFRPKSAPVPTPVLMDFHGGGWSIGSIDMEAPGSIYMAKQTGSVVVSVEYRLAPEHPFPAALDDCVAATVHVLTHGLDLGLDPKKVGVAGLSAGGNLAAAVPLQLQDKEFKDLPKLVYQVLFVPCLQGLDLNLPAYTDNDLLTGPAVLSRKDMAQYYLSYAGLDITPLNVDLMSKGLHIREKKRAELAKYVHPDLLTDKKPTKPNTASGGTVNETLAQMAEPVLLNYRLSPLFAPDDVLKRVPPAMVVASHYDVLRDDALLYVRRLRQAGVKVTSHMIANGSHLSPAIVGAEPGSPATLEAYRQVFSFIRQQTST